ncbi:Twinfilin, partial [Trachymyrmex cornetzi]
VLQANEGEFHLFLPEEGLEPVQDPIDKGQHTESRAVKSSSVERLTWKLLQNTRLLVTRYLVSAVKRIRIRHSRFQMDRRISRVRNSASISRQLFVGDLSDNGLQWPFESVMLSNACISKQIPLDASLYSSFLSYSLSFGSNDALKKLFAKCRDGKIRVLKISIENEELTPASSLKPINKWQDDYDKMIKPLIVENQPAYILYRLDTKSPDSGYDWLFISWSPDTAPVRQKMLYASTKATLKQEFGTALIKEELHGTVPEDITLDGYHKHKRNDTAPVPLTTAEEELAELKKTTVTTDYNVETRHQTLSGVAFPVTDEAKQAITELGKGIHEYIQLKIELEEEKIHLVTACDVSLDKLPTKVPSDAARYHLYNFKHTHEGDYTESIVFIYSMPGYNCSIKERMLYSSCKAPLLDLIQSLGVTIIKKLEIAAGQELTEEFFQEELHPKISLHQPKFAKPKGPPNRGAKRITKVQELASSGQEH